MELVNFSGTNSEDDLLIFISFFIYLIALYVSVINDFPSGSHSRNSFGFSKCILKNGSKKLKFHAHFY